MLKAFGFENTQNCNCWNSKTLLGNAKWKKYEVWRQKLNFLIVLHIKKTAVII